MQLGGDPRLITQFPDKPKGMHWRTYRRLRERAQAAEDCSNALTMRWLERLKSPLKRRR